MQKMNLAEVCFKLCMIHSDEHMGAKIDNSIIGTVT